MLGPWISVTLFFQALVRDGIACGCYPVVDSHCFSKPTAETEAPKISVAVHNTHLSLLPVMPLGILWDTFGFVIPEHRFLPAVAPPSPGASEPSAFGRWQQGEKPKRMGGRY